MVKVIPYLKEEDFKEAIVAPWLRKKGYTILRQHGHGPDEQGKDLIIESKDNKIGACIIKPKIHGQYSEEGNIEEVRNQVNAALNVPFPDYINKKRVKIDFAFVISENKITSTAKESIVESFKNEKVEFFSAEDIKEEYYALPLKIKNISVYIYFQPKLIDPSKIKSIFPKFSVECQHVGDENNFGVFNRTPNLGKLTEITLSTTLSEPKKIIDFEGMEVYKNLKDISKNSPLLGIFIYFEEDKTDKMENFFETYIKKEDLNNTDDNNSKHIHSFNMEVEDI